MKKIFFSLLLLLISTFSFASSNSSPGFYYGQVPTPGQWNSYFSAKLDYTPGSVNTIPYWDGSGNLLNAVISGDCTATANVFTCPLTNSAAALFATPPQIGSTAANTGAFTNITVTGTSQTSLSVSSPANTIATFTGLSGYGAIELNGSTGNPDYVFFAAGGVEQNRIAGLNAGGLSFGTGTTSATQFEILNTASTTNYVTVTGSNGGNPTISTNSTSLNFGTSIAFVGKALIGSTAPTIASGFGTSPSVVSSNGTATFKINVGTGGAASSGVVTMPAATTGWNCTVTPAAAPQAAAEMFSVATSTTSITITNYTASTGVALAWPASTIIAVNCVGF